MGDHIDGLLHEMERHLMANRLDRVEDIKAELKALGRKEDGTPLDAKKSAAKTENAADNTPRETR